MNVKQTAGGEGGVGGAEEGGWGGQQLVCCPNSLCLFTVHFLSHDQSQR